MKLSFSTLGCPKLGFNDTLSIAKDLGYSGIEIRGISKIIDAPDIPQFTGENIEKTKARLNELNLEIPIFTSACCVSDLEKWPKTAALAKRYADTAHAMGAPYIRVLGDCGLAPDGTVDDQIVSEHLKEIADYAKDKGVGVLIETNGDLANSLRLSRLIENVAMQNVGVLWDIHHPFRFFDEPPENTFELIGEYVKHVHIKDSKPLSGGGFRYEMPGYGDVPIRKCVELLENHGYEGYYSLEWVKRWDDTLEEPGIVFANYVNYMNKLK
jgi:sugar phosphate isomerase/epimerase